MAIDTTSILTAACKQAGNLSGVSNTTSKTKAEGTERSITYSKSMMIDGKTCFFDKNHVMQ